MDDKNTDCITPMDIKCQPNSLEQRQKGGHEGEETANKKEPFVRFQISCTERPQEHHEQINEIKAKENDKTDRSCPGPQDHIDGNNNTFVGTKVIMWQKENLEDSGLQATGGTTETSFNTFEIQNLEENQTELVNQSSRLQVAQAVNHGISEVKVENGPGFKKVNDQIVKVTTKTNRKQAATTANFQRKQHHSVDTAGRWRRNLTSSNSVSTSTDSEDEPKSHCSQYPVRPSIHRTTNTDQNLDLSDGDYATDEPSGPEEGKSPAKKFEVQELASQQEASLITSSSSESSAEVGSWKGRKSQSPTRKSPFHPSETAKDGREPESWRKGNAGHTTECSLQPLSLSRDLLASLFPAFKTKAHVEDEKAALGEA